MRSSPSTGRSSNTSSICRSIVGDDHRADIDKIMDPMGVLDGNIDTSVSRYFTVDFPFGLKILIDIAKLFDVETPEMNKVWKWYLGTGTIESVFEMPVDKEQFIEFYK